MMTSLQPLDYEHDGTILKGLVAYPDAAMPRPAVLLYPAGRGIGDLVRRRAAQLAGRGWVAIVADMYGGGLYSRDPAVYGPLLEALHRDPTRLRARAAAALKVARGLPQVDGGRIAALGYCFGGECVLELARSGASLSAVASLHGVLTTPLPAEGGAVRARVLVYAGSADPFAPVEHIDALRRELTAAGAAWTITEYGGVAHGFTDPDLGDGRDTPGIAYDASADRLSWADLLLQFELAFA